MTLTVADRAVLVLAALVLILGLVDVVARVWAGRWDAGEVAAVVVAAPALALIALMWWG